MSTATSDSWSIPGNASAAGRACVATFGDVAATTPPAGTSTTGLDDAPGYYEVTKPVGTPRGVVLLIHGGGWFVVGPAAVAQLRPTAKRLVAEGVIVVSVTSKSGCDAWRDDLTWFYDRVTRKWPSLPICAYGRSAGGHLALILASQREVACVVSEAGPTDVMSDETMRNFATAAFGATDLPSMSPLTVADHIDASVLLGIAEDDPYVPNEIDAFRSALDKAHPGVTHQAIVLDAGGVPWVHTGVTQASLDTFNAAVMDLIRDATAD